MSILRLTELDTVKFNLLGVKISLRLARYWCCNAKTTGFWIFWLFRGFSFLLNDLRHLSFLNVCASSRSESNRAFAYYLRHACGAYRFDCCFQQTNLVLR